MSYTLRDDRLRYPMPRDLPPNVIPNPNHPWTYRWMYAPTTIETPEQLRKRADEIEARIKREEAAENQRMIDKLRKQGYTVAKTMYGK